MPTNASPAHYDVAVVGAGIIGLAVARELLARNPHLKVVVLERERDIASHQTGNNSGVVHAGVYYAPGSLKANLCVKGAQLLYEYCDQHNIRYERCGKLIVATTQSEISDLGELARRATANGVVGIRHLDANELQTLEPNAAGIGAIYSPSTGITDFAQVARALASDVIAAGGTIHTSCGVAKVKVRARGLQLHHTNGATYVRYAVFCVGAWSDRLAVTCGADVDPRIIPFRGAYLRIRPSNRKLFRSLIYPVPDPSLPFLGIHITRTIHGDILIGPTALLAWNRDAHKAWPIKPHDVVDTLAWPGTWRLARKWWRNGVTEIRHAIRREALTTAANRYMPNLHAMELEPAFVGIRAQAVARNGRFIDDFAFSVTNRALHVRNAPSPAATASLAIAKYVVNNAKRLFAID